MPHPQAKFEQSLTNCFLLKDPKNVFQALDNNSLIEKYIVGRWGSYIGKIINIYSINPQAYDVVCALSDECYQYWQELNDSQSA